MEKKQRKTKRDSDFAVTAFRVVQEATKELELEQPQEIPTSKNPNAVALGRLGGLKGGKARLTKLSPEKRKEIAKLAATARWRKKQS
jgi:hypothetical protein